MSYEDAIRRQCPSSGIGGNRAHYLREIDAQADAEIAALREEIQRLQKESAGSGLPAEIRDALDRLPDGTWETWTSCSFRRITRAETGRDGDVLHALNQPSDGHADLSWTERECQAICTIVNGLRALPDSEGWVDCGEADTSPFAPDDDTPILLVDAPSPGTYRVMLRKVEEQTDG